MKKYIIIGLTLVFLTLVGTIIALTRVNKNLRNDLSTSKNNEKAYILENSNLKEESRVFKLTIDQLNYYNDSIIEKMNKVRKELDIKDKEIKSLQYLLSEAQKTDTVVFTDTLFIDPNLNVDTTMGDEWYNLGLKLQYPSTIIVDPTFVSEKYIITNYRKETIKPPKKCWFLRIFQRKHKVVEVEVVEKNPYIIDKKNKFIEILDNHD